MNVLCRNSKSVICISCSAFVLIIFGNSETLPSSREFDAPLAWQTISNFEVHHREFRSHSGADALENLITLCAACHSL